MWSTGPYYFPGMTTSGPAAVDVNLDGRFEVVIATYGGTVVMLDGRTGSPRWTYDAWAQRGELFFGHPAVGDLTGDGNFEIVLVGYVNGDVIALDAATGAEEWVYADVWTKHGGYASANGALVTDIDGSRGQEVVISFSGTYQVLALSSTGQLRWTVPFAGARFDYLSPVAADVDGNGRREIFVQDATGVLRQISATGEVVQSRDLGGESWVAPSFADVDGNGVVEVVAATEDTVFLLDRNLAVLDSHTYAGGGILPTPVVADLDRDGRTDLYTASWWDARLLRYQLSSRSLHRWSTLGGEAGHGGANRLFAQGATAEVSPDGVGQILDGLVDAGGVSPADQAALGQASDAVDAALDALLGGSTGDAIAALGDAVGALNDVDGIDTSEYEQQLVQGALDIAQDQLDRVVAMGGSTAAVRSARVQLALAELLANVGLNQLAIGFARGAANTLSNASYRSSACPSDTASDLYLVWLCEMQDILADVDAVAGGDADLNAAANDLEDAITAVARVDVAGSVTSLRQAVEAMNASSVAVDGPMADAADLARRMSRHYLDDATLAEASPPAELAQAETLFAQGEAAMDDGDFAAALSAFDAAVALAAP